MGLIAVVIIVSVSLLSKNLLSLFEQQPAPAPSKRFACWSPSEDVLMAPNAAALTESALSLHLDFLPHSSRRGLPCDGFVQIPAPWRWNFALVMVVLLLVLSGIIDCGRTYGSQLSVPAAARESVRSMAVQRVESTGGTSRFRRRRTLAGTYHLTDPDHLQKDGRQFSTGLFGRSFGHSDGDLPAHVPHRHVTSTLGGANLEGAAVMRCDG